MIEQQARRDLGTPAIACDTTVTLEIDGTPVTVPAGTSIMRAAALAGNAIPRLCATDALEPFGIPPEQGEILRLTLRPEARAMRGHRRGRANNHDSLCVLHFMLQEVCVTSPN